MSNVPTPKPSRKLRQSLASNIKRLREARGFTQKELAAHSGLSVRSVGGIEQGTANQRLLTSTAFATALDCAPADLLRRRMPR